MKRSVLTGALAVVVALAGCGGEACNSSPAPVAQVGPTACRLAANTPVTVNVRLCPQCTDSSPTCSADVQPGNELQIDSVVQQCQSAQGCDITRGCAVNPVPCPVTRPLEAGTYTVLYVTQNGAAASTSITVEPGGATSCTL
jgi:hypothetical protein